MVSIGICITQNARLISPMHPFFLRRNFTFKHFCKKCFLAARLHVRTFSQQNKNASIVSHVGSCMCMCFAAFFSSVIFVNISGAEIMSRKIKCFVKGFLSVRETTGKSDDSISFFRASSVSNNKLATLIKTLIESVAYRCVG